MPLDRCSERINDRLKRRYIWACDPYTSHWKGQKAKSCLVHVDSLSVVVSSGIIDLSRHHHLTVEIFYSVSAHCFTVFVLGVFRRISICLSLMIWSLEIRFYADGDYEFPCNCALWKRNHSRYEVQFYEEKKSPSICLDAFGGENSSPRVIDTSWTVSTVSKFRNALEVWTILCTQKLVARIPHR